MRGRVVAAIAALATAPTPARASEPVSWVQLTWDAPSECVDAAYVEREVERLLRGGNATGQPYMRASARVREVPSDKSGPWHIDLRTEGPEGRGVRTVTAESCRALADAAGLILALAIDPVRVASGRGSQSVPAGNAGNTTSADATPSPGSPTAGPPVSDPGSSSRVARVEGSPKDEPTRREPPQVRFAANAFAVIDTGTLPVVTPGLGARATMVPSWPSALRLEFGIGLFLDEATRQPSTRSGTFSLRVADVSPCLVTRTGRFELGACVGVEVNWISAEGLYESVTSHGDAVWPALRGLATGAYFVTPTWAFRADVGVGVNLVRPEFAAAGDAAGLIHRPADLTGRGAFGIEWWF